MAGFSRHGALCCHGDPSGGILPQSCQRSRKWPSPDWYRTTRSPGTPSAHYCPSDLHKSAPDDEFMQIRDAAYMKGRSQSATTGHCSQAVGRLMTPNRQKSECPHRRYFTFFSVSGNCAAATFRWGIYVEARVWCGSIYQEFPWLKWRSFKWEKDAILYVLYTKITTFREIYLQTKRLLIYSIKLLFHKVKKFDLGTTSKSFEAFEVDKPEAINH